MTAAKRTMPVGLWARLMVRLWLTTMRLRIARGTRNPLLAHLVLAGREPFLRQDFDQPRVEIDDI